MQDTCPAADKLGAQFRVAFDSMKADADRSEARAIADTTLHSAGLPTYTAALKALHAVAFLLRQEGDGSVIAPAYRASLLAEVDRVIPHTAA